MTAFNKGQAAYNQKNYKEAFKWLNQAAAENNPKAQYHLGLTAYKEGKQNPQKYSEAMQWFEKAAKQGNEFAIKKLRKRGISKLD